MVDNQQWHSQKFSMGGVERRGAKGAAPRSSAEGARIEAPKARDEAPKAPRGVGCGEGVSPPHWGWGLGWVLFPLPRKFLDFFISNDFCAFWVALFTVYLKLFYMQNGTFGLPKLKVTAAFTLAKIERDRERKGKTEIKVLVKYVDLLYGEVETPQKAWDIWG